MSKWYIATKKEVYVVEADNADSAFIELAKELSIEDVGILMICSTEPFDIGEKDDDLCMFSPLAYKMAGVISEEECDALMADAMIRVAQGFENE